MNTRRRPPHDDPSPASRPGRDPRVTLAERPNSRRQRVLGVGLDEEEQVAEAPLSEMVQLLTRSLQNQESEGQEQPVVKLVMRSGAPANSLVAPVENQNGERQGEPSTPLSRPVLSSTGAFPSDAPTAPLVSLPGPPRVPRLNALDPSLIGDSALDPKPGRSTRKRLLIIGATVMLALLLAWPLYRQLSPAAGEAAAHGAPDNNPGAGGIR